MSDTCSWKREPSELSLIHISTLDILRLLGCRTEREGDTVLVDASALCRSDIPDRLMREDVYKRQGHETYQEINGVFHQLDEREIVADWFAAQKTPPKAAAQARAGTALAGSGAEP